MWTKGTPSGRRIAKLGARYRRRSKQFLVRKFDLEAVMQLPVAVSHGGDPDRVAVTSYCSESPAQAAPASPAQLAPASPAQEAPASPVQEAPASPAQLAPSVMPASSVLHSIKYFANAGPDFEQSSGFDSRDLSLRVRAIAFYLPQFHAFAENDEWWGNGFSEWRNVGRGTPRFDGHYQPRIPRDLGYYDLNSIETIRAQSLMATRHGIEAFCFYYYWFNGKRLMDMPLNKFAEDDQIKQDFCIMWANENWTRTWDGHDSEVLIQQDYLQSDEADFIADTSRYMANPRYLQVDGRPLFILYRPGLLPQPKQTLERWRGLWEKSLGVSPLILMVQGFGDHDPRVFGLDGAVEFPPHKLAADLPDVNDELPLFDPSFAGHVRCYDSVIAQSLGEPAPAYPLIKTVSPHWDNDARREGRGMVLHGSTPAKYEHWLNGVIDYSLANPFHEASLVFINAWNEWAESAYLEPDVHYGHAYLNATQRAVQGLSGMTEHRNGDANAGSCGQLLLVGHDAHKHGAQMLLLSLASVFRKQFGMQVSVLLKSGGTLLKEYQDIAQTYVLDEMGWEALHALLAERRFDAAICNTSVTGDLVPVLKGAGLSVVSLIHEMPMLIEEFKLQDAVRSIDEQADHVVFPSHIVQRGFAQYSKTHAGEQHILPQGTYKQISMDESARQRIRDELGLQSGDKMILNVGYADLRKGFDVFLKTAEQWMQRRDDVHFVWAGALSQDMERWVQSDLVHSDYAGRIHLIGFTSCMSDYYSACDVLFLTSREDPYPTVVLEAMNVGVPVVLFKGSTGFDAVMREHGYAVPRGDARALEFALSDALDNDTEEARQGRISFVETNCQLDDYCFNLLQLLHPELEKVSVVVPNYNYEKYMPERLSTIFGQDMPVFEVIVLDDCSSDHSLKVIERCADLCGRTIRLVANRENSGNVFKQWELGLSLSRGRRVWIAEADDLAAPSFLSRSLASFKKDTRLSFTDSAQIDGKGHHLADSYDYYYRSVHPDLFNTSFVLDGREFVREALAVRNVILNVSAVVWDRQTLVNSLASLDAEIKSLSLVGDWRLYLACLDDTDASIAYINESLNIHRRHATSVTHALDLQHHLDEILAMHASARDILAADESVDERVEGQQVRKAQCCYEAELRAQFKLPVITRKVA
ncbi:MAG: glycosyltransferase [Granulosicoccus sp.]|nr:glycosyltransferase [Granulosicoccus sp.]